MDVVAIHRRHCLALLDTGQVVPFVHMFDWCGELISDPEQCLTAVAQLPDGEWACINLLDFEPAALH